MSCLPLCLFPSSATIPNASEKPSDIRIVPTETAPARTLEEGRTRLVSPTFSTACATNPTGGSLRPALIPKNPCDKRMVRHHPAFTQQKNDRLMKFLGDNPLNSLRFHLWVTKI
jgi:hypothetical protein